LVAEILAQTGRQIEYYPLDQYSSRQSEFQVLVHTTPTGMHGHDGDCLIGPEDFTSGQTVYDILYVPEETELLKRARQAGVDTLGGLGMLIHQGARSFEYWTGHKPDTKLFYKMARQALAARKLAQESQR
jgi:shikimate dehydrogenase